ncbi:hypothetical protein ASG87_06135 [Frateuria sp. Soil773]|uniref:hypothetical protein n=1 Tax=Frateuria sp. Soil773 TaxID=1736407 RepID=UPI0006F515AA|nr:hypothetical protein [Frateuria sp. Soil773]KRE89115.1 hypothetical protein ASG87_06135 [Frateuria sp. Soil773]
MLLLHSEGDPLLKIVAAAADGGPVRMGLAELCSHVHVDHGKTLPRVLLRESAGELRAYGYVINRLFDIDARSLSAHVAGWGNLSPSWFHRAMVSLWPAGTVCYPWAAKGASLVQLPLPTQWHVVARSGIAVAVPRYVFGFGESIPDTSALRDPIRKSIWSYFSWRDGDVIDGPAGTRNRFYVERPQGIPLLGARIGDEIVTRPLRGERIPEPERLRHVTRLVSDLFDCPLCEMLFYYGDDGVLTFHACSTRLGSVAEDASARASMQRWLASLCAVQAPSRPAASRREEALAP